MVAINRLTGHSPGFFSVYTMPPNQAVSAVSQRKINAARGQMPPAAGCAGDHPEKDRSACWPTACRRRIRRRCC